MAKDADARILRAVLRRSFPAFARKTFAHTRARPSVCVELAS